MGKLIIKKIKASSLTEVIVATTVLLVVFVIALVTLNNVMISSIKKNTNALDVEIEKLIYQYRNNQLKIPVSYTAKDLVIEINSINQQKIEYIYFSLTNSINKKTKQKRILALKKESL